MVFMIIREYVDSSIPTSIQLNAVSCNWQIKIRTNFSSINSISFEFKKLWLSVLKSEEISFVLYYFEEDKDIGLIVHAYIELEKNARARKIVNLFSYENNIILNLQPTKTRSNLSIDYFFKNICEKKENVYWCGAPRFFKKNIKSLNFPFIINYNLQDKALSSFEFPINWVLEDNTHTLNSKIKEIQDINKFGISKGLQVVEQIDLKKIIFESISENRYLELINSYKEIIKSKVSNKSLSTFQISLRKVIFLFLIEVLNGNLNNLENSLKTNQPIIFSFFKKDTCSFNWNYLFKLVEYFMFEVTNEKLHIDSYLDNFGFSSNAQSAFKKRFNEYQETSNFKKKLMDFNSRRINNL